MNLTIHIMEAAMYKCPFDFLWGVSCPGCGMTRAFLALLLQRDIRAAFYYHPLFPVVIIAAVLLAVHFTGLHRFGRKAKNILLSVFCILFVIVYVLRLIFCPELISIHPSRGLIFRLLSRLS